MDDKQKISAQILTDLQNVYEEDIVGVAYNHLENAFPTKEWALEKFGIDLTNKKFAGSGLLSIEAMKAYAADKEYNVDTEEELGDWIKFSRGAFETIENEMLRLDAAYLYAINTV